MSELFNARTCMFGSILTILENTDPSTWITLESYPYYDMRIRYGYEINSTQAIAGFGKSYAVWPTCTRLTKKADWLMSPLERLGPSRYGKANSLLAGLIRRL